MNPPTILDPAEFQLLKDHVLYLRKRQLSEKIAALLSGCTERLTKIISDAVHLPQEVRINSPKLSKGENYLGFPWHNLDFPRYFNGENIFAVRSLCWWGNNFIITFHLSGDFVKKYQEIIFSNLSSLKNNNFFYCINDQQWEHLISTKNYIPLDDCFADLTQHKNNAVKNNFIKIAKKFSLEEWSDFPELNAVTTTSFLNLLKTSQ